ncbi:hypothetical protein HHI36_021203 [Cryptolaemus montrouzieri]|uniref:Uncharacterized protein n=1 Tax=Cryptolaemus montrouzieri TaxID=559131 RepID=A0ABD2MW18_9CUCU
MKNTSISVSLILICIIFLQEITLTLGKPLSGEDAIQTSSDDEQLEVSTDIMEASSRSIGHGRADTTSSNPIAGLQNLLGNGLSNNPLSSSNSNQIGTIPPIMVLGMNQAILVPLTSLPEIFQKVMLGALPMMTSSQQNNVLPGLSNLTG